MIERRGSTSSGTLVEHSGWQSSCWHYWAGLGICQHDIVVFVLARMRNHHMDMSALQLEEYKTETRYKMVTLFEQ